MTRQRLGDEQCADVFLRQRVAGAALGDADPAGGGRREVEHGGIDQAVMDDHVGDGERTGGAQRQQVGRAGSGTDEQDAANGGCDHGLQMVARPRV